MRFLLLAAMLLVAPLAARAEGVRIERIDVVDTGIYRSSTGEETADPNAPTGTIAAVTTVTNVEATTAIPGKLGLEFGLRYVIVGEPAGAEVPLDFVITYPPPGLVDPAEPTPLLESRYSRPKTDRRDRLPRLWLRKCLGGRSGDLDLRDLVRAPKACEPELHGKVGSAKPRSGGPT